MMEAANRGAFDVGAKSVGLNISLPHEQYPNPYVTPELCFSFHYFALRKLHFLLRAKALVAFPGWLWHVRRTVRGSNSRTDTQNQANSRCIGGRSLLASGRRHRIFSSMKASSIRRIETCSGLPRRQRKSGTVSCTGTMRAGSLCTLHRERPELRYCCNARAISVRISEYKGE